MILLLPGWRHTDPLDGLMSNLGKKNHPPHFAQFNILKSFPLHITSSASYTQAFAAKHSILPTILRVSYNYVYILSHIG